MTSAADYHSCGLSVDDAVYCWGGNHDGQLGTGTTRERTTRRISSPPPPDSIERPARGEPGSSM